MARHGQIRGQVARRQRGRNRGTKGTLHALFGVGQLSLARAP